MPNEGSTPVENIAGDPRAHEIASGLLQQTGDAMMRFDFPRFAAAFHVPHEIETFEGTRVLKSQEDLARVFKAVHERLRREGVTDYVRRVIIAEFRDEDTIVSTHETRWTNGMQLLMDSYPAKTTLKCVDGSWLLYDSSYAVDVSSSFNDALMRG